MRYSIRNLLGIVTIVSILIVFGFRINYIVDKFVTPQQLQSCLWQFGEGMYVAWQIVPIFCNLQDYWYTSPIISASNATGTVIGFITFSLCVGWALEESYKFLRRVFF